MRMTIKLILVITLFCSTASIALADGEQTGGGRCDLPECSTPADPPAGGDSIETEAVEATSSITLYEKNIDSSDNEGNFSLIDWLFGLFG